MRYDSMRKSFWRPGLNLWTQSPSPCLDVSAPEKDHGVHWPIPENVEVTTENQRTVPSVALVASSYYTNDPIDSRLIPALAWVCTNGSLYTLLYALMRVRIHGGEQSYGKGRMGGVVVEAHNDKHTV